MRTPWVTLIIEKEFEPTPFEKAKLPEEYDKNCPFAKFIKMMFSKEIFVITNRKIIT
jgi:hypothetical protein